ncbi:hypothetical protein KEQ52_24160, partial [Escherichia coli]|nr:hypothetical protein [Escherichia coli]
VENFGKPLFINLHENNPLSNTRPDMKTPEKGIFGHFHVGPLRMQYKKKQKVIFEKYRHDFP